MSSSHNSSRRSFLKKAAVTAYVAPVIMSTQAHATYSSNGSKNYNDKGSKKNKQTNYKGSKKTTTAKYDGKTKSDKATGYTYKSNKKS